MDTTENSPSGEETTARKKRDISYHVRGTNGQFLRQMELWTTETYCNGYVDARGGFRVYRPDCPRTFHAYGKSTGLALRTHVVWWLYYGTMPPDGFDIHHLNHNKLDDRIENLEAIDHRQHGIYHNPTGLTYIHFVCQWCQKPFSQPRGRVNGRKKEGQKEIKYCSLACYHAAPKSDESRKKCSESLKRCYAEGRRKSMKGIPRKRLE